MVAPEAWVPLAEIARPHGVRGEVRLKVYNADSDILLDLEEVMIRLPDGTEHEVSVDAARRADQAILMKLYSIDDRDRAEELRGAVVCARRADFPALEAGEFYACDVEGAEVRLADGRRVGKVRELRSYPSVDVLIIDASDGGKPYEVPLVEALVASVDASTGEVTLATLDGVERG